ncbi:MAG: ribokinase [Treponema sp.]|jgi:ribokinase|nr:ribokinase [Treponema sp.]
MKVLVFGSLNIDMVFSVDHIVAPGETISSASLARSAGGKGANQAAALAKAGMPVYMAGKIGKDGLFLTELLRSYGVNTDHVKVYGGATGQAIIQVDRKGQNSIVLFSGGNHAIEEGEIGPVLDAFGRGDMVLLQNEIVHTGKIMEAAKKRGLRICLNPSPYDEKIEGLPLDMADIFFVNELEGSALAGMAEESPPEAILDALVARFPLAEIVLTLGKQGARYGRAAVRAGGKIINLPVADTTGAGDTFTGYFIATRARGAGVSEALATACKASSIAVSRKGAMESIPLAAEVFQGSDAAALTAGSGGIAGFGANADANADPGPAIGSAAGTGAGTKAGAAANSGAAP